MTKICAVCKRQMSNDECGDEFPNERVCDKCAGIETFDGCKLAPTVDVTQFDETVESHLTRYIENRNKRTGQTWRVVRRFQTCETDWKRAYDRVYIKNEHGTRVRIFYDIYAHCWKRS